jgi:hypothetical protein
MLKWRWKYRGFGAASIGAATSRAGALHTNWYTSPMDKQLMRERGGCRNMQKAGVQARRPMKTQL